MGFDLGLGVKVRVRVAGWMLCFASRYATRALHAPQNGKGQG